MKYSKLGNSGLKVSEVSFGCMSLEVAQGQTAASKLLRDAHDAGINLFDTANLYEQGLNEEMVGKALLPIRDEVKIATKVGNVWRKDGSGWDWKPSKELILTEVNESLRRLQTNYIDLYQLHGGTLEDPIDDLIEAFETLKNQGKIRAYGISSIRPNVIREWVDRSNMDCVMMQYSLLDRRPEEESLDLLAKHNISVITRGTLAKGMLINKTAKEYLGYSSSEVLKMQKAIRETGEPISAAIQFVLSHPAVASAVIGIRTKEQLSEILEAYQHPIPKDEVASLKKILKPNTYKDHR